MSNDAFELTLATALRDQAEEISMSTDISEGREILDSRLDEVDRRRRRRGWGIAVGLLAVAASVALVAFLAVGRPAPAPTPPADPAPGATYDGSAFDRPFRMSLPAWVTAALSAPTAEDPEHVVFNVCPGDPDCMGLDVYAFTVLPDRSGPATYGGLMAWYEKLAGDRVITLYDKKVSTVSGREMTTFSVTTNANRNDALGCYSDGTCEDFYIRNEDRYALVDAAGGPLLIGIRSFADNPWNAERLPQLTTSLATLVLLPAESSALPSQIQGVWTSRLSQQRLESTLQAADLGNHSADVEKELGIGSGGLDLRLYVDDRNLRLYTVDSTGNEEMLDQHECSRTADRLVCTVGTDAGLETLVLRWTASDRGLRLSFLSAAGPTSIPGVPNEALHRSLYTTSTWQKTS